MKNQAKLSQNLGRKLAALFAVAASVTLPMAANANAVTNVTITGVTQRWPWNNKVDISYTVEGGQTRASGVYCGLRFAFTANGQTYEIPGYSIGASAENGPHTVTWNAPKGIVTSDGSLTATLFTTNVPSGNDYMVVNLSSGDVYYEGLCATQNYSNDRYNNASFKTDMLVLRKVPKWAERDTLPNAADFVGMSGYPTGDPGQGGVDSSNSPTNWVTDRAYYIGVFPVTQKQYQNIYGSNPSKRTSTGLGDVKDHRPVDSVSWLDLRSPYDDNTTDFASTSSIPAVVNSNVGTFLQRLNFKTGLYFDLPTEVMFEIAERAGATTTYYWGDEFLADYAIYSGNSGSSTVAVGSRLPNNWGLYDTAGNVFEWCLDGIVGSNLRLHRDAFTPYWAEAEKRSQHGGGFWNGSTNNSYASYRRSLNRSEREIYTGFRVSLIAE